MCPGCPILTFFSGRTHEEVISDNSSLDPGQQNTQTAHIPLSVPGLSDLDAPVFFQVRCVSPSELQLPESHAGRVF